MAPCMRSCCCFRDMRAACQATAIFVIIIAGISLLWGVINLIGNGLYANYLYTVTVVELVFEVALLIIGILLIVGTRKGYEGRHMILAFAIILPIYLLFDIGTQIAGYVIITNTYSSFPWSIALGLNLIFWLARIIVLILGELAAISLYQILLEEGPNGPPHPQVVQQHQVVTVMPAGYAAQYQPAPQYTPQPQQYPGAYPPQPQGPPQPQQYPGSYPPQPQGPYMGAYSPPQQGGYSQHAPPPYPESQYSKRGPPQ